MSVPSMTAKHVVALCGGVGGAKLALGLYRHLGHELTVIVNTGDDFEHLGLHVSPDIDTVVYTLGGLADLDRGWGRASESWNFMEALPAFSDETWFRLGDRDLAMHVTRTHALRSGVSLGQFTSSVIRKLGITATILPMSDDRIETTVLTPDGPLAFQRYFVEQQCAPEVKSIQFKNVERSAPAAGVLEALRRPDLAAVILCPSNPYLSVDPILAVPGILPALRDVNVPVVAVSPLIGGQAVKGPTAKIMEELGVAQTTATIARHYPFLSGLMIDESDRADATNSQIPIHVTSTLMRSLDDRDRLAKACLDFAFQLGQNKNKGA